MGVNEEAGVFDVVRSEIGMFGGIQGDLEEDGVIGRVPRGNSQKTKSATISEHGRGDAIPHSFLM